MDPQQLEEIINRTLDYFDPLPLAEIRVVIVPRWHPSWSYLLGGGGMMNVDPDGLPYILLAEGFDEAFPNPYATDIVVHEVSHLIDMALNGATVEDPARWQITSFILEQEHWI